MCRDKSCWAAKVQVSFESLFLLLLALFYFIVQIKDLG